ncbi:MAG: hypothetical protein FJ138_02130 [Deltaproteobacteria bacterium]|nr:hypothetical protein [Deltaproteobacteria bacterium]
MDFHQLLTLLTRESARAHGAPSGGILTHAPAIRDAAARACPRYRLLHDGAAALIFQHVGFSEALARGARPLVLSAEMGDTYDVDSCCVSHDASRHPNLELPCPPAGEAWRGTLVNLAPCAALLAAMSGDVLPPSGLVVFEEGCDDDDDDDDDGGLDARGVYEAMAILRHYERAWGPIDLALTLHATPFMGGAAHATLEGYARATHRDPGRLCFRSDRDLRDEALRALPCAPYRHPKHPLAQRSSSDGYARHDVHALSLGLPLLPSAPGVPLDDPEGALLLKETPAAYLEALRALTQHLAALPPGARPTAPSSAAPAPAAGQGAHRAPHASPGRGLLHMLARVAKLIPALPPELREGRAPDAFECVAQFLNAAHLNVTPRSDARERARAQSRVLRRQLGAIERGEVPFLDPVPTNGDDRPLCVMFLSAEDDTLAVLGDGNIYATFLLIKDLSAHFKCVARVVGGSLDLNRELRDIQGRYPGRPIQLLYICGHGGEGDLDVELRSIEALRLLAPRAAVVLDACELAICDDNIAAEVSDEHPSASVFACDALVLLTELTVHPALLPGGAPEVVGVRYGTWSDDELLSSARDVLLDLGHPGDPEEVGLNLNALRPRVQELLLGSEGDLDALSWGSLFGGRDMLRYSRGRRGATPANQTPVSEAR